MSNEMKDYLAETEAELIHVSSSSDGHEVYYDPSRGMYCVRVYLEGVLKYETWFDPYDVVEPIVYAEWDDRGNCSSCHKNVYDGIDADIWSRYTPPRCPNCGAHMRINKC